MALSSPCSYLQVLCFVVVLCARAQNAAFQDVAVSDAALSPTAVAKTSSSGDGEKWLQLEKVTRDAVEQAAAIEAEVAALAKQKEQSAAVDFARKQAQGMLLQLGEDEEKNHVKKEKLQKQTDEQRQKEKQKLMLAQLAAKEQLEATKARLVAKEAQLAAAKAHQAEQNRMETQMIDGMEQAVAVMRVGASQEVLKGNAAKVRLGCAFGCSGHGACDRSARKCACSDGWLGEMCDQPRCHDDCNGNGLCVSGMCKCHDGWIGNSCEKSRCPGDCNGNGYCFEGECMCNSFWSGANCLTPDHTPSDLRVLLRQSLSRTDTMSPPSPSVQPLSPGRAAKAKATTAPPTVAQVVPDESALEDILPEVDAGEDLPWQHARVQAMHTSAHTSVDKPQVLESKVVETNATSFRGAPLTADWIAPAPADARQPINA